MPDIALDVSTLQIVHTVWRCVGLCDVLAASHTCIWSCWKVTMCSLMWLMMCCVSLCDVVFAPNLIAEYYVSSACSAWCRSWCVNFANCSHCVVLFWALWCPCCFPNMYLKLLKCDHVLSDVANDVLCSALLCLMCWPNLHLLIFKVRNVEKNQAYRKPRFSTHSILSRFCCQTWSVKIL